MVSKDVKEVLEKYGSRIESQIQTSSFKGVNYSREYVKFKGEMAPELNRYERWCKTLGSVIRLKPSKKDEIRIKKDLEIAHLDVSASQSLTLSVMAFLTIFFIGLVISVAIAFIKGGIGDFPILFFLLVIVFSMFLFMYAGGYPARLANKWRLKASSQMVPAILYIVVYMRHTPNLEKAIAFASEHLQYPLALDLKKVFYNVEIGKFSTIKESLDNYLEVWRDYSTEFIEAFHLVESSLFEPDESRRIATLEKSLQVVLDGVYDKMLKFSHDVRSPLTNIYMLGVVLPTLALALLPLASAMVGGAINWIHVFLLFNLIVPFFVFYLTDKVLLLRPGGYGESTLLEKNPLYPKYKSKTPYLKAFFICFPLILIGLFPLIFQYFGIGNAFGLDPNFTFGDLGFKFLTGDSVFGFKENTVTGGLVGPFGIGALIMGMFLPIGIALFFSISFKEKTKEIILERRKTRELEKEFNGSLFQLGNRIGNGVPPELAFGKVAESSKGLKTEDFFKRVNYNIRSAGMSVDKAIFDPQRGAMIYYPSDLIATSMRILIESSKKGLKIAAISLMSISEYVKNIGKITNRLKDLLAEIVSDMKSNMTFLAPLLSGIVVGLATVIVTILDKLKIGEISGNASGISSTLTGLFQVVDMIPPYFLQISVGIYLVQIIFILTGTLVTIDSGQDKLEKTNKIGKNLMKGMTLYFIVALVASIALFGLGSIVIGG